MAGQKSLQIFEGFVYERLEQLLPGFDRDRAVLY